MRVALRDIAQAAAFDPKRAILDAIGDFSSLEVFGHQVLVGTYIPPERTKGGIILPDNSMAEARYQGKCALVLKVGPNAFVDDAVATFGGVKVEPGEWVFFRNSDGWEFFLGQAQAQTGASVRLIDDICIKGRVPDPSMIY
jgi:co-chaperonin GroES (HSP10)